MNRDQNNYSPYSKEARGQRTRQLRELTGSDDHKPLSRAAIERKYGLSAHTLRHWEEADGSGLTENGARIIVNIYQSENINCSVSWLLTGKGSPPKRREVAGVMAPSSSPLKIAATDLMASVEEECQRFKAMHPEGIVFEVVDDAMLPRYLLGDRVGGIQYYHQDIPNLIGKDCIVEIKGGGTWLRRLQKSTVPGQYNLYALNPNTKVERPTLYGVEILTCAPVMRIWRGKKWLS